MMLGHAVALIEQYEALGIEVSFKGMADGIHEELMEMKRAEENTPEEG
jgi:hypothetical protein